MNGANDGLALLGNVPHGLHNRLSHEGIKATRGLVAEENVGIGDRLEIARKF